MPTYTSSKLPPPKSWNEFEDMVADVAKLKWRNPNVTRYGRPGQRQKGIDIIGESFHISNGLVGVQCKNLEKNLDINLIKEEIQKAELFEPPIKEFIFSCTNLRDAPLQREVMGISQSRKELGKFPVLIWFWEDISLELAESSTLIEKHYPQFLKSSTTYEKVIEMIKKSEIADWEYEDIEGVFTYKPDVNLTIKELDRDLLDDFSEPWVKRFPDPKGYKVIFNIFYGNSFIKKEYVVGVDGFRGYIPYPENGYVDNPKLTRWKYKIGKIIHSKRGFSGSIYSYDNILKRANISVLDED